MSNRVSFSNTPAPVIDVESTTTPGPVIESTVTAGGVTEVVDSTPVDSIPTGPANTNTAVAVRESAPGYDDEDISFEDIILPALNIVQGIGDLSKIYNPGEITLNQSLVVHQPANPLKSVAGTKPLVIVTLGFRKRKFVEDVKFGEPANVFSTEAEVAAAGGTLDYNEAASGQGKKLYNRLATGLFLVQKPEHIADEDHLVFSHECEGRFYSLALWSMKKTSYTGGAKIIYTARKQGHLRTGGYPSFTWNLTTKFKPFKNGNGAHVPILTPGVKNTPAFAEFVQRVLTSGD